MKVNQLLDGNIDDKNTELKNLIYTKQTHNRIISLTISDMIELKKKIYKYEQSTRLFRSLIRREEYTSGLVKAQSNKYYEEITNIDIQTELSKIQHESDLDYFKILINKKENFLRVK